jgi:hypothetical protein
MTSNELRTALAGDDGSLPERWNPDDVPGTMLIGTLLRYELIVTKLGEATMAVIEDDDDGTERSVLLGCAVLKKRFETLDPKPGDSIGLKYVGYVDPRNKDQNGYHNYVMKVQRNSAAPAIHAVAADTGGDDDLPF